MKMLTKKFLKKIQKSYFSKIVQNSYEYNGTRTHRYLKKASVR